MEDVISIRKFPVNIEKKAFYIYSIIDHYIREQEKQQHTSIIISSLLMMSFLFIEIW